MTARNNIASLATDLQEVLAEVAAAEAANVAIRNERDTLNIAILSLQQQVSDAVEVTNNLNDLVAAKDAEIASVQEDHDALEATLVQVIAEKDAEIAHQAERIADLSNTLLIHEATIAAKNVTIVGLNERIENQIGTLQEQDAEIARLTALLKPTFILGDATRKQFLGAPFTEPFPGSYESAFWPSTVTEAGRSTTPIVRAFVSGTTMPKWRASYPNAKHWFGDLELFHSGGLTVAEVAKLLPAYQGARDFADNEGKGLQLGAYGIPPRFGTHMTDAEVMAQAEICRPILDLLDYCLLTLYPIYTDMEKSRTYIRRNIDLGRRAMPGKKVIVLGAPGWHPTVGAPLAGTPISVEWWRMLLEECREHADGFAIWMKADQPKPTAEPWWLETEAFLARAA
jgi:hypothetical protein